MNVGEYVVNGVIEVCDIVIDYFWCPTGFFYDMRLTGTSCYNIIFGFVTHL